jgi:hypothetical protein
MFLIVPAHMLFAGATLLDATASRVLVLLVAIVLTAVTLLPTMLTCLATILLALSTVTALLLAALVLALAALLLATLLLVHEFLLRESCLACGNVSETRRFRNSIDLLEIVRLVFLGHTRQRRVRSRPARTRSFRLDRRPDGRRASCFAAQLSRRASEAFCRRTMMP